MADDKTDPEDKAPQPARDIAGGEGETKKVDTDAQEDAAKDREDAGGYQ